ncbi:glycosyltransferase [Photobacterium halotolerans]|uniref:glycosyltransferase n=1 Tax=Photobacterium halotolerans TaxID=265726 RepID=UPI0003F820A1|nr:glycosyltransferase [Photobacterium halotolerans]
MKKKVIILTNMFPTSKRKYFGVFVKEQYEALKENTEHEFEVLVWSKGGSRIAQIRNLLATIFSVVLKVVSKKVDIIHVHYGLTGIIPFILLPMLKLYKVKTVVTFHGSDILGESKVVKKISKLVSGVSNLNIAVSFEIFNKLSGDNKKIWLPCGVDALFYSDNQIKLNRKPVVIFPSSPSRPEKDFDKFLSIMKKVEDKIGCKVQTVVLENLSKVQILELFTSSCCLLMTSKYEGSPQTVKEAVLTRLPVASTDVGDVVSIVSGTELSCVTNDENVLSDFVAEMVINKCSSQYPKEFTNLYLSTSVANKLSNIYQEI